MKSEFIQILAANEKGGKKGGSLGAVLKLVQDLAAFEDNIQDCVDAQEVAPNKEAIKAFLTDIDKMYDILLKMAKDGIAAVRQQRGQVEVVEDPNSDITADESLVEEAPVKDDTKMDIDSLRQSLENTKSKSKVVAPKIPTM